MNQAKELQQAEEAVEWCKKSITRNQAEIIIEHREFDHLHGIKKLEDAQDILLDEMREIVNAERTAGMYHDKFLGRIACVGEALRGLEDAISVLKRRHENPPVQPDGERLRGLKEIDAALRECQTANEERVKRICM